MRVTICVITYQRPEGLKRLLEGLRKLEFKQLQPEIHVVVVDNDESGQALRFCNQLSPDYPWRLTACMEPRRGISYARNRAIATAPSDTDFIAFIDDDEVPESDWLEQLLLTQIQHQADVVHGPVLPHFQPDAPTWAIRGRFFENRRYPTGHLVEAAYTNNVLMRAELVKDQKNIFQERFALTGGEDSYFFRCLHQSGKKLVWADEAIVYEWIPDSRTTVQWILQRGYRSCLSYSIWEKEAKPSVRVRLLSSAKALLQMIYGLMTIPLGLIQKHLAIASLLRIFRGAGRLAGLLGLTYQEYKTIHKV
ncbi:glycosyltransferase family 2 protein [Thermoleptolyngbya oregonensis NK1-22]|uniref:Glycosyltransferase family 2 protein n=1 Tax=Thermoleptolyngbya oregonensis NK1-22 TaxID=2547457 RepID=A0AA96Y3P0_9CYAN|nr:glycosyltransferase family 2 protein [Thermoleptolyngbya oregonensis]WOB42561.1 glycosyltransferase family 2 protein [Thermoleptolyngbya oregonensis NK1-22]